MAPVLLEVQDLTTRFHTGFGVVRAVSGVSYQIQEGETVGIVGESGSGKSVSMLSMLRLVPQPPAKVSGTVLYKGRNLLELPRSEMRRLRGAELAIIFQDPMTSLNPVLSIGQQMTEALRVHQGMDKGAARRRAIALMRMVGIPQAADRLNAYPHHFSGGMLQRVMIAIAISCNPTLLIADEPTTALDVTIQAQIIELVKHLCQEFGMTLIWITHDLGVVAGLVDRVMVMYAGHVVEEAPVDELYQNPQHPYTLGLLNSIPRIDRAFGQELVSIRGAPPDLTEEIVGCPFAPRCNFVRDDLCREHRPPLYEVRSGHRSACWVDVSRDEVRQDMLAEAQSQPVRGAP